jgi:two-component system, LuxR family, response regulator FixJ
MRSKVYIVDDDEGSRDSIVALVTSLGLAMETFESAECFLNYLPLLSRPSCLVSDYKMPGVSGLQFLGALKTQGHSIPTILLTAFADVRMAVSAMQNGAVTVLEKPCDPIMMWDSLQTALEQDNANWIVEQRGAEAREKLSSLTDQENQVLHFLTEGLPNKVIASKLEVSLRTVESRRSSVFAKLSVRTIAEAIPIWIDAKS